jgi:hypothetical protein
VKLSVALIVRKLPLLKNLRLSLLIVVSTETVPEMRFILENFPSPKGAVYGAAARAAIWRRANLVAQYCADMKHQCLPKSDRETQRHE